MIAEGSCATDAENHSAADRENFGKNLSGREVQLSVVKCIVEIDKLMQEQEWEFWVYQIACGYGFAPAIIEDICNSLLEEAGPKRFMQRDGEYVAVKERGLLKFYMNTVPQDQMQIETTLISRESWRTRKAIGSGLCPTLYMDAAKIEQPLTCRPVAAGDRFSPLGLRGSKKVTDYLSDIKFENLHKGNVLVMCDASGEIICIPGIQISNKVRVSEATRQILQIEVR
jgi:tRNA(Ile)-lysidine synthase